MSDYLNDFSQMIELRGLAQNTFIAYQSYLKTYLSYLTQYLNGKPPEHVSWDELRQYIAHLRFTRKLCPRSINAHISQLRFFYLYVLHLPWNPYQLPFQKFYTYMPSILSQTEAKDFINSLENLKHKAVIALLYSAGLRVSEVCSLKYQDISRKDMKIYIRPSKNRSDRFAILSKNTLEILTQYWQAFGKPKDWLFPGTKPNSHIVTFTVNRFVNDHLSRLGWNPKINCHSFRHSFGTHLYENGADLLTIKTLLGHKSLNSTTIYVHLSSRSFSNAFSPFDVDNSHEQ